ncbi:capsule assembly Wzi family protein [Aliiglaciecola sp. 3_MG-2023]|uniref:capsule assembly Wzi family protein n=1 Tax=Aliiglaciecola sp. 3_MG-2023 TaxID=3062644 RepID=UPI0026E2C41B|nr:capsule assembly Wzi family protein [Aliiglaciecola sp. 3_MG-2023]MDO6693009.1 capsule assembly Wzi family protein [Aliiglaciecola sp. 3_MG-2023]
MPKCIQFCLLFLIFSGPSLASPWVGTTDPQLHYDVQILNEFGYLDSVTTTFPMPWKGISEQLLQLDTAAMPPAAATAAKRLKHYLTLQQHKDTFSSVTAYGASERTRYASFDGQQGEKGRFNINSETRVGRLAGKLSVNFEPNGEQNLDQSYLAYQLGDWNLRLGSIDQWWGPSHANSLILSNNARPIPTLALSRSRTNQSDSKWLSFLGPWYVTAQVGQLEDSRDVPDAKIWASRFTSRPIPGLEVGLSWLAVWGGDGQPDRMNDFFRVLSFQKRCADGADECDPSMETHIGNHLAGIDAKYTFRLMERPVNIYAQYADEGKSSEFNVSNQTRSFGISSYVWNAKVYMENSDTNVSCDDAIVDVTHCYYESGTYSSGYRYYNRELGEDRHTDARMTSLGVLKHFADGDVFEAAIRYIKIDDANENEEVVGLTEKITQLSGYYQTVWGHWQVKVGAVIDASKVNQQGTENDVTVFSEIKYSL